ncbi:MAG TPA: hypothetical protein VIN38_10380 [Thiobacillus sp.]
MDQIDRNEANQMRSVLEVIFGMQALDWPVTYATYEAFGKLVVASGQNLNAINLIPRPFSFSSPYKWSRQPVRQGVLAFFNSPEGQSYLYRMKSLGLKKRADFEKARSAVY